MRITKVIATATAIAALSTSAFAGGLSDQIMEAPVVVEEEMAPAGTSVSPALIVVGILGLLIFAGSSDSGGDDGRQPNGIQPGPDALIGGR